MLVCCNCLAPAPGVARVKDWQVTNCSLHCRLLVAAECWWRDEWRKSYLHLAVVTAHNIIHSVDTGARLGFRGVVEYRCLRASLQRRYNIYCGCLSCYILLHARVLWYFSLHSAKRGLNSLFNGPKFNGISNVLLHSHSLSVKNPRINPFCGPILNNGV